MEDKNDDEKEIIPVNKPMRYVENHWSKNKGSKKPYNFKKVKMHRKIAKESKKKNRGK